MREVDEVIVHCSATRPSWWEGKTVQEKRDEIRRWHVQENKWSDIGYHYVIDRDGSVAKGRSLETIGAHTSGHNTKSIGICLIGGHGSSATDAFSGNFTSDQEESLRSLINELKIKIPKISKISGHNDYTRTKACPGFKVGRWIAKKPPARTSAAQSTTVQASAAQIGAGVGTAATAVGALDGVAQLVALGLAGVIIIAGLWIFKERIEKWKSGDR